MKQKRKDRIMKKKLFGIIAIVALTVITAVSLVACGPKKTDWEYIQDKGKITVGYTVYEPMNYLGADNKLIGFETEFAQKVGEELGLEVEFQEIDWKNKVAELDAKNIDLIWNGMTKTDELGEQILFSTSYMKNAQVAIIKKENAGKYTSKETIDGVTIAYEEGGAADGIVNATFTASKDAKKFTAVKAQSNVFMEIAAGTTEVGIVDLIMAGPTIANGEYKDKLQVVDGLRLSEEEYAIGIRKGDTVFQSKINEAIKALKEDGTLKALAEKYAIADMLIK